jgi:hypothetical protein
LEHTYVRPKLYAKQSAAFFSPLDLDGKPARYSWIEGSTKSGKTVSSMAWLFEQALPNKPEISGGWTPQQVGPKSPLVV